MEVVRFICLRFSVRFFRHGRWLKATTYVFKFFTITFRFLSVSDWDSPHRDLAEIVRKQHSHHVIFMTSAQKSHDARAMSLQAPYDYLKSLQSFLGPNDYLNLCVVLKISVRCLYGDRAI